MNSTSITHIGHAHNDWLRSLKFYKQELRILKDRLTQIGGNANARQAALEAEQYENRLKVQQDNIKRLRHNISNHMELLNGEPHSNGAPSMVQERYLQLGSEFSAEERAVNELRNDFSRFSASWI